MKRIKPTQHAARCGKTTSKLSPAEIDQIRRDPPRILNVPEAAAYLGQSIRKTNADIEARRIPSIKLGGRVLLCRDDIDSALRALTRGIASVQKPDSANPLRS